MHQAHHMMIVFLCVRRSWYTLHNLPEHIRYTADLNMPCIRTAQQKNILNVSLWRMQCVAVEPAAARWLRPIVTER